MDREEVWRVRNYVKEKLQEQINKTVVLTNDVEDILRETGFYKKNNSGEEQ